jgi:CheY-like chemotaxis protein
MFRQILVNLLSNAVKFTESGGRVTLRARRDVDDLVVGVDDTGIGIASEHQSRIFDEFFQVDGSYSRNYEGTGLGLALVRRMMHLHGGVIELCSAPGEGSRFTCRFPGCIVDQGAVKSTTAAHAAGGDPVGEGTILVVEDHPVNRKLACRALRASGFAVLEAETGEIALELLGTSRPDLILMDLQLPGMDGLEVTRRIHRLPALAGVPIVALTAHANRDDERRAREAGCSGYIAKPIRLSTFAGEIRRHLEITRVPIGS